MIRDLIEQAYDRKQDPSIQLRIGVALYLLLEKAMVLTGEFGLV